MCLATPSRHLNVDLEQLYLIQVMCLLVDLLYFSDYKTHPPIWEENGGASYSPNVAYLLPRGVGAQVAV